MNKATKTSVGKRIVAKQQKVKKQNKHKLLRKKLRLSQQKFWNAVGLTQSRGSRIEMGLRSVPNPVEMLIRLVHKCGFPVNAPQKYIRFVADHVKNLQHYNGLKRRIF